MKTTLFFLGVISIFMLTSCSSSRKAAKAETTDEGDIHSTVVIKKDVPPREINTGNVPAAEVVAFSQTLIGIKYTYGSAVKEKGFDCSGFIDYVFNHFDISAPRSSVDFTNVGEEVSIKDCKPGDLILFTGSDAKSGVVGHLGIITENKNGDLKFIHASTSRGVMISGMNSYFIPRFVKVNRIFTVF